MIRSIVPFVLAAILTLPASAQTRRSRPTAPEHFVAAEFIFLSAADITYDYQAMDDFALRAGLTTVPAYGDSNARVGIPLMVTWTPGGQNVRGLLGAGAIVPLGKGDILPTLTIGVRVQPADYGLYGTLAWRPIIVPVIEQGIIIPVLALLGVGVSAGYCF